MLLGLVGKPSCGKSTFFKAATLAEVEIASYPFTTIKANHGMGYVKVDCIEKEFNTKCNPNKGFCLNGNRFVPVELMDVAGLVEGASEGKGLGNQFLDDLRTADVFIHIVDASGTTNEKGETIDGGHNPCVDMRFLEKELNIWYYNILMKVWKGFVRKAEIEKSKFTEAVAKQFSGLKVSEENVKNVLRNLKLPEKATSWSDEQIMKFAEMLRKESKPMIIVANKCDHPDAKENIEKIKKEFSDLTVVACSADSEVALRQAAKAGLIEYIPGENDFKILKDLNEKQSSVKTPASSLMTQERKEALERIKKDVLDVYGSTGVQDVLNIAVFDLLKYVAIFPASANKLKDSKGRTLPDCFLLPPDSTALDFAYFLHTDFGKGFIKAIDARSRRALGKDYLLKNRDALEIVTR